MKINKTHSRIPNFYFLPAIIKNHPFFETSFTRTILRFTAHFITIFFCHQTSSSKHVQLHFSRRDPSNLRCSQLYVSQSSRLFQSRFKTICYSRSHSKRNSSTTTTRFARFVPKKYSRQDARTICCAFHQSSSNNQFRLP